MSQQSPVASRQTTASIDAALECTRMGIEPPHDERKWVVVEIVDGCLTWTTHNIALRDARHLLEDAREDMREEMRKAESGEQKAVRGG